MSNIWLKQQNQFSFAACEKFHVALVGDCQTGKTSFLDGLSSRKSDSRVRSYNYGKAEIICYECHRVADIFYLSNLVHLHAIFFFIDSTKIDSLNDPVYQLLRGFNVPLYILVNKIDSPQRHVTMAQIMNYVDVIPLSVHGKINLHEPFDLMIREWRGNRINGLRFFNFRYYYAK